MIEIEPATTTCRAAISWYDLNVIQASPEMLKQKQKRQQQNKATILWNGIVSVCKSKNDWHFLFSPLLNTTSSMKHNPACRYTTKKHQWGWFRLCMKGTVNLFCTSLQKQRKKKNRIRLTNPVSLRDESFWQVDASWCITKPFFIQPIQ